MNHTVRKLLLALAVVAYVPLGVPALVSGLVAPAYGVAIIVGGWAVGLGVLIGLVRRRSLLALLMPPAAIAYWALVLTLGERLLGWQA